MGCSRFGCGIRRTPGRESAIARVQLGRLPTSMTRIHLRYVDRFVDRHGHVRHYFRRPGGKRFALPGAPGSDEFMSAYRAALAGKDMPPAEPKTRGEPGTFSRLAAQYFVSPDFLRLRTRTQHVYRLVIERFL